MKSYLGSSEWKRRQPKVVKNWWPLILLALLTLLIFWTLAIDRYADRIKAICPIQGCVAEGAVFVPEYGTKAWLTVCYNQYDTYEDRIKLC